MQEALSDTTKSRCCQRVWMRNESFHMSFLWVLFDFFCCPASFLHTFINITSSPLLARAFPFLDHRSLCRLSREFIKTRPWAFNRRSRQSAHQKTDTACLLDQSPMDLSPHLLGAPLLGTNPVACERLRPWWVHGHERLETALGEIIDPSTWARNGRRKYV